MNELGMKTKSYSPDLGENKMSFYIPAEDLEGTKKVIRSLDSLRFIYNPLQLGDQCNIYLSGSSEDMNKLHKHLEKYSPREEPKPSFRNKLKRLRKILLISNAN